MDEKSLRKILRELGISVANRSGQWLNFSCPFARWTHQKGSDSSPSCGAKINENGLSGYKCLSCKKHGRISGMVRALEYFGDEDYGDLALRADLADSEYAFGDYEGDEPPEVDELNEPLQESAYGDLYGSAWEDKYARAYLKSRGISKETSEHLELGFDEDEERVIFPVRHLEGELYGFTGRSILEPEDYPYKKYAKVRDYLGLPKRHLILGAHFVGGFDRTLPGERDREGKPIFVVEGLFGYAHLFEIGADEYVYPVALLGSEMTSSKASIIREWNRLTVLAFDDDEGGDSGLFGSWDDKRGKHEGGGAIDKLVNHVPLIVPPWPKGKNDPDQLTIKEVKKMALDTALWNKGKNKNAG